MQTTDTLARIMSTARLARIAMEHTGLDAGGTDERGQVLESLYDALTAIEHDAATAASAADEKAFIDA